jgi:TonB family protein
MYSPQLEKIKIAAPCTAEWRWMYGNDRVRFCSQCNLNVYNLSALTTEQAEDLIRGTEGRLCVRFYRRRDGSIITQNCPQGLQVIRDKFNGTRARVAAALLTFLGSLGLLWWVIEKSLNSFTPTSVMGGLAEVENLPIRKHIEIPAEIGQMIMPSTVERSEKFIRDRAIFKVTPVFHSDISLKDTISRVVVNIMISPEGQVTSATAINGHSSLREVAEEAVRRWKFQPMEANGLPATVESKLTFRFAR